MHGWTRNLEAVPAYYICAYVKEDNSIEELDSCHILTENLEILVIGGYLMSNTHWKLVDFNTWRLREVYTPDVS